MATDLKYLTALDQRLHVVNHTTYAPNIRGHPVPARYDTYTDSFLEESEMERVLKDVASGDYVFYPVNTDMGFSVGFQVVDLKKRKPVLLFIEEQLPEGYTFDRLSAVFMARDNVRKAKSIGIDDICNDHEHYDY